MMLRSRRAGNASPLGYKWSATWVVEPGRSRTAKERLRTDDWMPVTQTDKGHEETRTEALKMARAVVGAIRISVAKVLGCSAKEPDKPRTKLVHSQTKNGRGKWVEHCPVALARIAAQKR